MLTTNVYIIHTIYLSIWHHLVVYPQSWTCNASIENFTVGSTVIVESY